MRMAQFGLTWAYAPQTEHNDTPVVDKHLKDT